MPKLTMCLLLPVSICALAIAAPQPAAGQAQEKSFNLRSSQVDTTRAQEAPRHEPQIRAGELEGGLSLGYMDLNTTLLTHDQILYKITDERIYWGDVTLMGGSAFNPVLRLGYNFTPWFGLEGQFNFSVSEYEAEIENAFSRENTQDAGPPVPEATLGEFDAEHRSVLTYGGGLSALLYPFNLGGSRISRWQPYVIATYDQIWFDLNSNYTRGTVGESVYGGGGGMRFIADELISIRLEASYLKADLQLDPAENFEVLNEGTFPIPLYHFTEGSPQQVESFEAQSISGLAWSIALIANF